MLIKIPDYVSVLVLMEQTRFKFHLTGSRFFGYDTPESDWDFFVDASVLGGASGLENWLRDNEFHKDSSRDYAVTNIIQVWKHGFAPIHIQIVEDARQKANVQAALEDNPRLALQMRQASKEARKVIWDVALALYSAGEERCARSLEASA